MKNTVTIFILLFTCSIGLFARPARPITVAPDGGGSYVLRNYLTSPSFVLNRWNPEV